MVINIINHQYKYDVESLARVFFPFEKVTQDVDDNIVISTQFTENEIKVCVRVLDKIFSAATLLPSDSQDLALAIVLYESLSKVTDIFPKWGILTGVRPAKLMHKLINENGREYAKKYFQNKLLVSEQKTNLALNVTDAENKIISLSGENSYSLYVSIPFCPTRCTYCSFVSHSMKTAQKLVDPYVDLLVKELEHTAKIAQTLDLKLETIYFGGGTPTTLSHTQLEKLFVTIEKKFDLSALREYTVEAGRPDTITEEKLCVIRNHNITRISINPQSFNDDVLKAIGRNHTAQQTVDAFKLSRKLGFDNINMDFIAGLPNDDLNSFKNSIDTAVALGAESVTVHTLAMKRAAYMVTEDLNNNKRDTDIVNDMVDYSNKKLGSVGYYPYYMYRQSKSVGNLENVGWSKFGKDCLYNVYMMDETHTVLAVGAGSVTKLRSPYQNYIDRIYNFKYPYEYIDRFDELIERKNRIISFYNEERAKNGQQ